MATRPAHARNRRTGMIMVLVALAMLGMGFAAVPFYRLFCQVTGFNGTTQRATADQAASAADLAKRLAGSAGGTTISVRFDSQVERGMPWTFRPLWTTHTIAIGERDMAVFVAQNNSDRPITGAATFNVVPEQTGRYFNKIQCFCFTQQTLQPHQAVRMPVIYYVDPKILADPDAKDVEQITLSYTFHEVKEKSS
ncbi:MAG: cytochrome c oxidase assembly protein [Stellaceae bacterium]